jgi:hypothetical protein
MLQLEARPKAIWPDFLVVMCVAQADAGNGRTGSCHYEAAPGARSEGVVSSPQVALFRH